METTLAFDQTEEIISRHVGYAMAAAAVPVPLADVAAVTLVQLDLVRQLADRYGVEVDWSSGRAAVLALAGAGLARVGASLIKVLPGAGWLVGAATQVALSGGATWALGQVYRQHFEARGTLDDLDVEVLRERYRAYVARGVEIARELGSRARGDDDDAPVEEAVESLERLARLRRAGILTEEQYRRLAEPLLDR